MPRSANSRKGGVPNSELGRVKKEIPKVGGKREKGIEPSLSAWKAEVLPLNYSRICGIRSWVKVRMASLPYTARIYSIIPHQESATKPCSLSGNSDITGCTINPRVQQYLIRECHHPLLPPLLPQLARVYDVFHPPSSGTSIPCSTSTSMSRRAVAWDILQIVGAFQKGSPGSK